MTSATTSAQHKPTESEQQPVRIFVSYSHLDRKWFRALAPLLKFRSPTQTGQPWHDNELKAGNMWHAQILKELDRMDIFLCLVSYNLLASEYVQEVEMPLALARQQTGKTIIIPLMLFEMDRRDIPELIQFNPLPAWGRSWRSFEKHDGDTMDAHKLIRTGLLDAIETVRQRRGRVA